MATNVRANRAKMGASVLTKRMDFCVSADVVSMETFVRMVRTFTIFVKIV